MTKNKKVRITQIKSKIGSSERQKRTLLALGLKKLNSSVEKEATPQVIGMANKIKHLVLIEDI